MKKYLAPNIIIKLGFLITCSFAYSLLGSVSESLNKNRLIEDWNRKQTQTIPSVNSSLNSKKVFFSVDSEHPYQTSVREKADPRRDNEELSQPPQHDLELEKAVADFNHVLMDAVSSESPAQSTADNAHIAHNFTEAKSADSALISDAPLLERQQSLSSPSSSSYLSQANEKAPKIEAQPRLSNGLEDKTQPILIRFNNVSIIEYLRFLSGISHKNFIFDENDLQFNITMISEEPTSIEDFMTALLQELRIHDLTLLEQGNNLVIHKNPKVNSVSTVITEDGANKKNAYELVTQVFRLNTADAEKVAGIIRPLISEGALVEVLKDSNHIILTDLVSNVTEIGKLIRSLDSPKGGMVIGQYVVRTSTIETILPIVQQLMGPISSDQSIQYVPFTPSNSIFVVSTPFLVERALSVLQHLDHNQKSTKILDLKELRYQGGNEDNQGLKRDPLPPAGIFVNSQAFEETPETPETGPSQDQSKTNKNVSNGWKIDEQGNWIFKVMTQPNEKLDPNLPPQGKWTIDQKGNWLFVPGVAPSGNEIYNNPKGNWTIDPAGNWEFELDKGESISINVISRSAPEKEEFLPGSRPRGQFFLHKVHYRKGEELERSFQAMSDAIRETENVDPDLVNALASVQWLESSNSLVFSGTPDALAKIAVLVDEIDIPLRQVFIEMLILEATLADTLNYSVKWANRFGGGNWAGGDGFTSTTPSPLSAAMDSTGINNLGQPIQINPQTGLPVLGQVFIPNPIPFNGSPGFDFGVIGQRIFNKLTGIEFESMGAFINCLRGITSSNIVLNPKIITEDGIPAEIFVGNNIAYQTQSIVNDQGVILTSNFEYRDVGTRLKVTPYLGGSDIIALEIENEITSVISNAAAGVPANSNVGPNTSKSSTTTRVHIPSGFFLVISGMIRDETRRTDVHAPCLGGIPVLGAAFKDKKYEEQKRNLMIFIQPRIIDTDEEMQCLTKHQQDIMKFKNRRKQDQLYETEEFMDFINLKKYEHERTTIEFDDDEEPL